MDHTWCLANPTKAAAEIAKLREALEDAVDTLEAMDVHIDNPLYDRLRAVLEPT